MLEPLAFWTLVGATLLVFCKNLSSRTGYLAFPTLFCAVYLGWVIPQAWDIRADAGGHLAGSLATLHIFAVLCLLGTVAGWHLGLRTPPRRRGETGRDHLHFAAALLTVVAGTASLLIGFVDTNTRGTINWSGPATILSFVSGVGVMSLFLSLYLVLRERTAPALVLATANLCLYAGPVLVGFRRAGLVEAFVCAVFALWFARRLVIPRVAFLAALAAGMALVFAVGALRSAASDGALTIGELRGIDFLAHTPFGSDGSVVASHELTNALHLVRAAEYSGHLTGGVESWNRFVFQWVPGQIVGHDLKDRLMVDTGVTATLDRAFGYEKHTGTTTTGLGEAYLELRMLGFVPFTLVAFVLGRWWRGACRGDLRLAALYVAGLSPALHAITHYAVYFFNHMLLLAPSLLLSLAAAREIVGATVRPAGAAPRLRRAGRVRHVGRAGRAAAPAAGRRAKERPAPPFRPGEASADPPVGHGVGLASSRTGAGAGMGGTRAGSSCDERDERRSLLQP